MAVMTMEHPISEAEERRQRAEVMRRLHDQLDPPAGWRVEIIEGELVVSPAPAPAHGYIVEIIRTTVANTLAREYRAYENIEFAEPEFDIYIPDLSVWPQHALRSLSGRPDASLCRFAVEVTSPGRAQHDYSKAAGYARCGIPTYLIVDRKRQRCVVFTEPGDGEYRDRHETPFGKPVTLPREPPVVIDTSDF